MSSISRQQYGGPRNHLGASVAGVGRNIPFRAREKGKCMPRGTLAIFLTLFRAFDFSCRINDTAISLSRDYLGHLDNCSSVANVA